MKLHWSPKTKITVVMILALCLPVAALITAQLLRLYYYQQTKPVHAVINQQLQQVIKMVEYQVRVERDRLAVDLASAITPADVGQPDEIRSRLERAIATRAFPDLAVFYSPQTGAIIASSPAADHDREAEEHEQDSEVIAGSLKATYDAFLRILKEGEEAESKRYATEDVLVILKRDRNQYNTVHYVLVKDAHKHAVGVLGFTLDRTYVREKLLPGAYASIPAAEREKSLLDWVVVAVRSRETGEILWSSEPIDWSSEQQRASFDARKLFDSALNFHFLLVKLKDKSIEQISREFWIQNLVLVLGLAVVMFGGLLFTWRSVNREMELARLKSDFVSNVSHELKTPLALIRMFAETLELGRVRSTDKAQEYYTVMRRESERLTGLINNLLDFSRIEAGAKQYKFEPTSLPDLVETTLENYRYHLKQKGFELEEKIDRELPQVAVDREAYSLCLLNLLDNAVKYSGDSRYVAVRLGRENGSATLEVEDRGIGIQRKDQGRIFEKFYRAGDPLVHNTKGSGLGLSLVQHVAQAHHGTVAVESAPGQGSRFILRVPIDDASRN